MDERLNEPASQSRNRTPDLRTDCPHLSPLRHKDWSGAWRTYEKGFEIIGILQYLVTGEEHTWLNKAVGHIILESEKQYGKLKNRGNRLIAVNSFFLFFFFFFFLLQKKANGTKTNKKSSRKKTKQKNWGSVTLYREEVWESTQERVQSRDLRVMGEFKSSPSSLPCQCAWWGLRTLDLVLCKGCQLDGDEIAQPDFFVPILGRVAGGARSQIVPIIMGTKDIPIHCIELIIIDD